MRILFVIFIFGITHSFAQNLVLNPGFEEYHNLPSNNLHFRYLKHWKNIQGLTMNTYYHTKGKISEYGISFKAPDCWGNYQEPRSGNALAQIMVIDELGNPYAVIGASFKEQLKQNHEYYVELYVNLADYCEHTISSFNICFSDKIFPKDPTMKYYYNLDSQIRNAAGNFIIDKEGWTKISGTFRAKGGETYIAMGNFSKHSVFEKVPAEEIKIHQVRKRVYFFLDDFLVVDITEKLSIEPGKPLILKNIFFDTGKYELLPASITELIKLELYLKAHPDKNIQISGHTDNTGSSKINTELSKNRAKAVVEFLVSKGINENRLEYAGFGSSKPVDTNKTHQGRQNNRRVEVNILNK